VLCGTKDADGVELWRVTLGCDRGGEIKNGQAVVGVLCFVNGLHCATLRVKSALRKVGCSQSHSPMVFGTPSARHE